MNNQTPNANQRGSAIIWTLAWLGGLGVIGWAGYTQALPRFEQKLQSRVHSSIDTHSALPITVDAIGRNVTLSGEVASEEAVHTITRASREVSGIGTVTSNLTIASPSKLTQITDLAVAAQSGSTQQPSDAPDAAVPLPPEDFNDTLSNVNSLTGEQIDTASPDEQAPTSTTITTASLATSTPANRPTDNAEPAAELISSSTQDQPSSNAPQSESQIIAQAPSKLPTISVRVAGDILAIEGDMANSDATDDFVQTALDGFGLDVVSNGLQLSDDVAPAEWLSSLTRLIPLMKTIANPSIDVLERQITLAGIAPSRQLHDAIITEALVSLGDYSLVERISIDESSDTKSSDTKMQIAEVTVPVVAEANTAPEEDIAEIEAAKAEELAQAAAAEAEEAAKAAVAEEIARAAAEAAEEAAKVAAAEQAEKAAARAEEAAKLAAATEAEAAAKSAEAAAESITTAELDATSSEPDSASEDAPEPKRAAEPVSLPRHTGIKSTHNSALREALTNLPTLRILFESDSNILTPESRAVLDQIAEVLLRFPDTTVAIEGHTDSTGERERNLDLSLRRATTVRDYLIGKGVSVYNLRALGFGEEAPIADNRSAEGRAINRRIDFTF